MKPDDCEKIEIQVIKGVKKLRCPICNYVLYNKHEGLVCKNYKCIIGGFKCAKGWVYLNRKKEDSSLFFTSKYDFDLESFRNKKKWLKLKSKILYEKGKCEICGSNNYLHVHHILPRSSNPELAMDIENLMVLCKNCHKEIHKEDKYKFG